MRKRSKYRPKGVFPDPVSWVLAGLKPFTSVSVSTDARIKNHDAMDTLRRGDGTKATIDVLIGAFNMCMGYAMLRPELGADWHDEIKAGLDALYAVGSRGAQSGRFILKAEELKAMNLVMELHDTQLENTTVRDMELALEIVERERKAKRARAIVKKEAT